MKSLFVATILLSGTALAQVSIDQALQIRNSEKSQALPGMEVGRIDTAAAKKAAESLGGRVSIHFTANESVQVTQAPTKSSGGVIVGSGTEGASRNVVVSPPIRPNMSITVSAREGSQNDSRFFCVRPKNANPEQSHSCMETGKTMRILQAGTYLVFFKTAGISYSTQEVTIKSGDNLIIPAREIQVPYHPEVVDYVMFVDYSSSQEIRKLQQIAAHDILTMYKRNGNLRGGRYSSPTSYEYSVGGILKHILGQNLKIFLDNSKIDEFGQLILTENSIPIILVSGDTAKLSPHNHLISTGLGYVLNRPEVAVSFFNVLPGTYSIKWKFKDGQIDATKGIVVE